MENNIVFVDIDLLIDNPFQTREESEDNINAIIGLADSILSMRDSAPATKGLMQIPRGRLQGEGLCAVDLPTGDISAFLRDRECQVQLAFGHRRRAAFRYLVENHSDDYRLFPVVISSYSDEDMAIMAWSENCDRQDITPYEQAIALQRMSEVLGWTHKRIAEKLNLERQTVTNKIRMLSLPDDLLARINEGDLSQRRALALLTYYTLPEDVKKMVYGIYTARNAVDKPTFFSAEDIRSTISAAVASVTRPLIAEVFPYDTDKDTLGVGDNVDIKSINCRSCSRLFEYGDELRCSMIACYEVKAQANTTQRLIDLSQKVELPIFYADENSVKGKGLTFFDAIAETDIAERALKDKCPNLHITLDGTGMNYSVADGVSLICVHPDNSPCQCKAGSAPISDNDYSTDAGNMIKDFFGEDDLEGDASDETFEVYVEQFVETGTTEEIPCSISNNGHKGTCTAVTPSQNFSAVNALPSKSIVADFEKQRRVIETAMTDLASLLNKNSAAGWKIVLLAMASYNESKDIKAMDNKKDILDKIAYKLLRINVLDNIIPGTTSADEIERLINNWLHTLDDSLSDGAVNE